MEIKKMNITTMVPTVIVFTNNCRDFGVFERNRKGDLNKVSFEPRPLTRVKRFYFWFLHNILVYTQC